MDSYYNFTLDLSKQQNSNLVVSQQKCLISWRCDRFDNNELRDCEIITDHLSETCNVAGTRDKTVIGTRKIKMERANDAAVVLRWLSHG